MAKLHFANLAPSAAKGTLLSILHDSHIYTSKETMETFLNSGGLIENWGYIFSLVIITDRTKSELDYLIDDSIYDPITGEFIQKYKFKEPTYGSTDYWEIRNTGQIELTFSQFEKYIELA